MHDKYITIIDICLIYYQSDVYTVLSCNKMYAFYYRMIAFSMNVRFLHRLRCCHGSPFSIDFLGLGGSHVNLN
jgi:hypothetical protein